MALHSEITEHATHVVTSELDNRIERAATTAQQKSRLEKIAASAKLLVFGDLDKRVKDEDDAITNEQLQGIRKALGGAALSFFVLAGVASADAVVNLERVVADVSPSALTGLAGDFGFAAAFVAGRHYLVQKAASEELADKAPAVPDVPATSPVIYENFQNNAAA